jgi:hypothetical protein
MAKTESEIVELMNKRIDAAFTEEKDRKNARNRARVNFNALTVGSGDRRGVRTLDQVAKYLADNPHDYSLQAIRDRFAPASSKPQWKPRRFLGLALFTFNSAALRERFSRTQSFFGNAIKRPISAGPRGIGNSSVFRHAVLRTGLPYVLAESGLGPRERIRRPEIGGRKRTFFGIRINDGFGASVDVTVDVTDARNLVNARSPGLRENGPSFAVRRNRMSFCKNSSPTPVAQSTRR